MCVSEIQGKLNLISGFDDSDPKLILLLASIDKVKSKPVRHFPCA